METPLEQWIEDWVTNLDWEAKAKLREAVQEMVQADPEQSVIREVVEVLGDMVDVANARGVAYLYRRDTERISRALDVLREV